MIQFKNVSTKTVAAVRFGVSFVDALGDTHKSVYSYDSDSTVKAGKTSGPKWGDGVEAGDLGHKVGAIVWVEKLRFADNTFFVDDGRHSCGAQNMAAVQLTASPAASGQASSNLQVIQKGEGSKCSVVTDPPGAEVDVDGNKAGVTPFVFVLLKHGDNPRTVTIKLNGYKTVEKKVVPDGNNIPIDLTLEKD